MPIYQKFYRSDIQGLRVCSALVIMVYHIWLSKVSGGVDVFFVVSGFLIASNFLREIYSSGSISILKFWSRMASRILPSALLVIVATSFLTLLIVPAPLWKFGINEMIASILQIENWELYRTSTDYLNRDDPPSQFQQFWALSIQMQIYVLMPLLCLLVIPFIRRSGRFFSFGLLFATLAFASFAWSIYFTSVKPSQAYFSTFTRIWEFFAGVLVALAYPFISNIFIPFVSNRIGKYLSNILYIGSVLVLGAIGILIPVETSFPGWVSLLPVACAVIFIASGAVISDENRLKFALGSPLMQKLGELSFTVYLWHWPLLIFAQHGLQSTKLDALSGIGVITLAVALAWLTHKLVEDPSLKWLRKRSSVAVLMCCFSVVFVLAGSAVALRQTMIRQAKLTSTEHVPRLDEGGLSIDMIDDRPNFRHFVLSNYDRPEAITRCLGGRYCEFGDTTAKITVALVGASHAAQWQPVMDWAGKMYGFKLVTVLSTDRTLTILDKVKPSIVVTTATITGDTPIGSAQATPSEHVSAEQIALWSFLNDRNIPVIAIRDNPRFLQYQNGCVWQNSDDQSLCSINRESVFLQINPAKVFAAKYPNLHLVDLSDLICLDSSCPAVLNGILVYYDRNHFSNSFMRHIAGIASGEIQRQAPGVLPDRDG